MNKKCRLLSLLFLLLISSPFARADNFLDQVTYNAPQSPGSVIIRYGGLRGLFIDEYESQVTNLWVDSIKLTLPYKDIWDDNLPYETLANFVTDNNRGGRWWERPWYLSCVPEKGGAPHPRVYDMNRVTLDLWLFQLNSKMKLKVREFSFSLHSDRGFKSGGPRDFWRLRIRPQLTLGPPTGVRRASLSLVFEWHLNRTKMWEFEFYIRYKDSATSVGFEAALLKW